MDYTNPNAKHSQKTNQKRFTPWVWNERGVLHHTVIHGQAVFIVGPSSSGKTTLCNVSGHGDPPPQGISKKLQERSCGSKVSVAKRYHRDAVGNYDCTNTSRSQHVRWNQQSIRFWRHYLTVQRQSAVDPIVYVGLASKKEALEMQSRRRRMPKLKNLFPLYQQAMFGTSR